MSNVYSKSISSQYAKYFEQSNEFIKPFRQYSLAKAKILMQNVTNSRSWETGMAGIPIEWLKDSNTVVVDHTDSHTLVIGPTGSKKSRLVAMPLVRILGSTGESMIISDPKAEIFNRTAAYLTNRAYKIFVLNLRSPMHGDCWNPLSIPYAFFCAGEIDRAYEFVNDIAENLIQTDKATDDPFWDNSAGSLFFGLSLLLFKYCRDFNKNAEYVHIGNVIRLRNAMLSSDMQEQFRKKLWNYAKTDHIISSALIGTVQAPNETKSSILSVFDQKVRRFSMQPNLLDMLSASNIDLDLIGQSPTAIFLILPDEKTGYHSLVSLFIKQSYEYIIFKAQQKFALDGFHVGQLSNRVNYILDEFSSLPTIRDFPAMITAARSRNIRFNLIVQSKHQLLQRYKDETETIQTNCNNWIFFTSRELQFLEEISSLCGKTSAENPRPILSVSALQRLDKDAGEALILTGRQKPHISHLADIDKYDGGGYGNISIASRPNRKLPLLDFDIPLSDEEKKHLEEERKRFEANRQRFEQSQHFASMQTNVNDPFNVDELIAKIDSKIAELEKEEKDENEAIDSKHPNEATVDINNCDVSLLQHQPEITDPSIELEE